MAKSKREQKSGKKRGAKRSKPARSAKGASKKSPSKRKGTNNLKGHRGAAPLAKSKASAKRTAGRPRASAATRSLAARKPAAPRVGKRSADSLFAEAVERAMQGYVFDAISLFRDAVKADPKGGLADDALFNIGTCYLRLRLVNDAEEAFTTVLDRYPTATIAAVANGQEQGRTAAKALLGRLQARIAQGDVDGARADRDALLEYGDSWATDPAGRRRSFHEIAVAMLPEP